MHWAPIKKQFVTATEILQTTHCLNQALSLYRSRFSTIGLFENSLYPQIREILLAIRSANHKTFVATSKPVFMPNVLLNISAYHRCLMAFMVVNLTEIAVIKAT